MRQVDKELLAKKITEVYPWTKPQAALDRAQRLLGDISDELTVNLWEWVNGEEISDVWTGGYCVRMVMEIRGDNQFLEALEALVLYSKDEKAGLREIWRTRK